MPTSFFCAECRRHFYNRPTLLRHQRAVHQKNQVPCPHCQRTFHDRSSFLRHERNVHAHTEFGKLAKPWTCARCLPLFKDASHFATKRELYDHKRRCHSFSPTSSTASTTSTKAISHLCNDCGKSFPRPSKLQRHRESVHRLRLDASQILECEQVAQTITTLANPNCKQQIINGNLVETLSLSN